MIALMILAGIAIWLVVVIALTVWIPRVLGEGWPRTVARLILFPVLLVLPIADEWIGRRQFKELCEREAVVYLFDDWRNVKRAKKIDSGYSKKLTKYLTRSQETEIKYQDMDTGRIFLSYKVFYNYGGFLMDKLGLRLSGAPPDCWPKNYDQIWKEINLQQLLDQGK